MNGRSTASEGGRRAARTASLDRAAGRRGAVRRCRYRWVRRPPLSASFVTLGRLLAQPLAMVLPGPAAGDRAAGHGGHSAFNPDRGIEMDDPDADNDHRGRRVHDCGNPLLLDGEDVAELGLPHHQAAEEQRDDANGHEPEDELLAGVVAADLRQILVARRQHVADAVEPLSIGLVPDVVAAEADEQPGEREYEDDTHPGVQNAR